MIRQRQSEGIAAAKARGVRFGRKALEKPAGFDDVYMEWKESKISARLAAKRLRCSHQTFLKWAHGQ